MLIDLSHHSSSFQFIGCKVIQQLICIIDNIFKPPNLIFHSKVLLLLSALRSTTLMVVNVSTSIVNFFLAPHANSISMIAKEPSLVKIFSSMLKGVCSTIKKLRWRRPRKCWEAKEIVREIRERMHTCVEGNLNLYCHDIYRELDQHYFHRERSKERISCCNYKE